MTELIKATERSPDAAAAANLLYHYGFDLGGDAIAPLLLAWQERYPAAWIRLATIEALYQGRYKAVSVAQILAIWQRRSQPTYHFNHEFERLICDRLPQFLALAAPLMPAAATRSAPAIVASLPHYHMTLPLSGLAATPLHNNADVMQALRTLNEATADTPLANSMAPEARSLQQTYSYTLRSEEPPSSLTHQQMALPDQHQADTPLPASALEPSDTLKPSATLVPSDTLVPLDSATPDAAVSAEPLQGTTIAATNTQPDREPIGAIDPSTAPSTPESNGAQTQATTPRATSIARILQQLDNQALSTKTIFPGIGLLAQTLQPTLHLHQTARYQPLWLPDPSTKQPIHQFTPTPEASDFHSKLKAAAQVPETVPDQDLDGELGDPPLMG